MKKTQNNYINKFADISSAQMTDLDIAYNQHGENRPNTLATLGEIGIQLSERSKNIIDFDIDPDVSMHELVRSLYDIMPDFLQASVKPKESRTKDEKDLLCLYNAILYEIIDKEPELRPTDILLDLESARDSIYSGQKSTFGDSTKIFKDYIRGVRHEYLFYQILENSGFTFYKGTIAEDREGTDFIVERPDKDISIDVKASTSEIEYECGHTANYCRKRKQDDRRMLKTIFWSGIPDSCQSIFGENYRGGKDDDFMLDVDTLNSRSELLKEDILIL